MSTERLESLFPNLKHEGYKITSIADVDYNCIAWAVSDTRKWWEPLLGSYWPPGTLSALEGDAYGMVAQLMKRKIAP